MSLFQGSNYRLYDVLENVNKASNFRRYEAGFYGNKLQTWPTTEELRASDFSGRVVLRYKGAGGGTKLPKYGQQVSVAEALSLVKEWRRLGASPDHIKFNEAAPDSDLTIQGEVMHHPQLGYALFWNDEKTQMRAAMESENAKQHYCLQALGRLKYHLTQGSYDDVMCLLDLFPGHVIEFSAYRYTLGSLRGRNAVIWECRRY